MNGTGGPAAAPGKGLVDLHTHTTWSDGSLTPTELVSEARRIGLAAVAVTDHDTGQGLEEALTAGRKMGVEVVPGVEFSISVGAPGHSHLVGLFIDHTAPDMTAALERMTRGRLARNSGIVDKLRDLGLTIGLAEIQTIAGPGQVVRPHIALALVKRGYAADVDQAMDRYIGRRAPAYVGRDKLSLADALSAIHSSGGLAILAHPLSTGWQGPVLAQKLTELRDQGLDGMEVLYYSYNSAQKQELDALARRLGLLVSGGSDFHGSYKPHIKLGYGRGDLRVGLDCLKEMKTELVRRRS